MALFLACVQEVEEPALQIAGRFARYDGTGLTSEILVFSGDELCISECDSKAKSYPLADNYIWDNGESAFKSSNCVKYVINKRECRCSLWTKPIAKNNDTLLLGEYKYVRLDGFKEEPYSSIQTENYSYEKALHHGDYSFPVIINNPIPAGKLTAKTSDDWISNVLLENGVLSFSLSATSTPREGTITLKYTHAIDAIVSIRQLTASFIQLEETSMSLGYSGANVEIAYSIVNPVAGSELTPSSTADWIKDFVVLEDKVCFTVDENNSFTKRSGTINFTYEGAEDVRCEVTQIDHPVTISLDKSFIKLTEGDRISIVATPDVPDAKIVWSTSDESVLAVDNTGTVVAKNPGDAYVTASCGTYSSKCDFVVEECSALCLEAREIGTFITIKKPSGLTIGYKKTGEDVCWLNGTSSISIPAGEKVWLFGDNDCCNGLKIQCSSSCYIYGNVMSLISSTDYNDCEELNEPSVFAYLFTDNKSMTNHPTRPIILPATILSESCYSDMFSGCTGLVSAPELPATTLAESCYRGMFSGCTGLVSAPELPATTLARVCYYDMFRSCTGLVSAPELPATTLAESCYSGMFRGCTGLVSAPELPATTLAESCYYRMFSGCTGLVSAPELPATTLAEGCYFSMFNGCTSLTAAPVLPAVLWRNNCYRSMFADCCNLNHIEAYLSFFNERTTSDWVRGVSNTGTFVKRKSVSNSRGDWAIPVGWDIVDASE